MTTIDQRILIPAPQTVVWAYISDLNNNTAWQEGCDSLSYLTSKREGPGTRWRYSAAKGRESVVEITAWYNGLGYEYVFVDGPAYKNNRGRIRLQEIPEGTIVQWTFSFEVGGMLSGIRGPKRQLETSMANSLKTLYRKIKQFAADGSIEAKSLMRDAPDVEARSHYRPRHPTKTSADAAAGAAPTQTSATVPLSTQPHSVFAEPPIEEGDGEPITMLSIEEPPVAHEDTRPRTALTGFERPADDVGVVSSDAQPQPEQAVEPEFEPELEPEPEFLNDISFAEPLLKAEDTQQRPAVKMDSPAAEFAPESEAVEAPAEPDDLAAYKPPREAATTAEHKAVTEQVSDLPAVTASAHEPEEVVTQASTLQEEASTPAENVVERSDEAVPRVSEADPATLTTDEQTAAQTAAAETSHAASIWEIFGVPRPSEGVTAPAPTVSAKTAPTPQVAVAAHDPVKPHVGLRIKIRRRLVRLRRPL